MTMQTKFSLFVQNYKDQLNKTNEDEKKDQKEGDGRICTEVINAIMMEVQDYKIDE